MSVVHEAICDGCGKLEGRVHQTDELALGAAVEKGWVEVDAVGLLCRACKRTQAPTVKATLAAIRATGATARRRDGEWRVNLPGGTEKTAYYTDDAQDAIGTAKAMMARQGA